MYEFAHFWWSCLCWAVKSAWSLAGFLDLLITIVGVSAYDRLKRRGLLPDRLPSKGVFLLAMVLVWLIPATFVFAPYWRYQLEHAARLSLLKSPPITGVDQTEIARLRAAVKRFEDKDAEAESKEWAPLTEVEIAEWTNELKRYQTRTVTVFWGQFVDARRFFKSLQAVGKHAGFTVSFGGGWTDEAYIDMSIPTGDPFGASLKKLLEKRHPVNLTEYPKATEISIFLPEKGR